LTYQTDELEEDVAPAGPISPSLLVRHEVFRGKFRNSFTTPDPFTPWKVEKIEYTMRM
jgi:hypothetical protein